MTASRSFKNKAHFASKLLGPNELESKNIIIGLIQEAAEYLTQIQNLSLSEDDVSQRLIQILQNLCRTKELPFNMQNQYKISVEHGHSPIVDMAVVPYEQYSLLNVYPNVSYEAFFHIEAKRLCKNIPIDRHKEYVVGRYDEKTERYISSGGIERFKQEKHGKNLSSSAMVGYVQTDSFEYWHNLINIYIEEQIVSPNISTLVWEQSDKLILETKKLSCNTYISEHKRNNAKIVLKHVWINLSNKLL